MRPAVLFVCVVATLAACANAHASTPGSACPHRNAPGLLDDVRLHEAGWTSAQVDELVVLVGRQVAPLVCPHPDFVTVDAPVAAKHIDGGRVWRYTFGLTTSEVTSSVHRKLLVTADLPDTTHLRLWVRTTAGKLLYRSPLVTVPLSS